MSSSDRTLSMSSLSSHNTSVSKTVDQSNDDDFDISNDDDLDSSNNDDLVDKDVEAVKVTQNLDLIAKATLDDVELSEKAQRYLL